MPSKVREPKNKSLIGAKGALIRAKGFRSQELIKRLAEITPDTEVEAVVLIKTISKKIDEMVDIIESVEE